MGKINLGIFKVLNEGDNWFCMSPLQIVVNKELVDITPTIVVIRIKWRFWGSGVIHTTDHKVSSQDIGSKMLLYI